MPCVVTHQSSTLAEDLTYVLTGDWTVYVTPPGYIYQGGWLKSIIHLRTKSGKTPWIHRDIFFDFHYSYYDIDSFYLNELR